jgi:transporter family protein
MYVFVVRAATTMYDLRQADSERRRRGSRLIRTVAVSGDRCPLERSLVTSYTRPIVPTSDRQHLQNGVRGFGMQYLWYALLALVAYALVPPLTKLATQDLPADTVALVTNGMLAVVAFALVIATDKPLVSALTHEHAPYMYAAGICLSVGIIAYYRALADGPVSVVVPIFGLFLVASSVVGILFLDEALTLRKGTGIVLAVVAVFLTTVEG